MRTRSFHIPSTADKAWDIGEGVSIVICCHNSARLLPKTLAHLAVQKFSPSQPPCEVVVVDNASTDRTSEIARESWPGDCPIPLRVVREPALGLTFARLRGIAEAKHEIVSFVDDDNRVNSDWVETVSGVMSAHPEVGACGGQVEAASDIALPEWFERFQSYYAVGQQSDEAGDVTETRGYLWGAGLCLRKQAWRSLIEKQFNFLLSDRKGKTLTAGGDAELCYALRLGGWRLWYEPRLRMQHFLPASRLQWKYLRRVSRGFGAATAGMDSYEMAIQGDPADFVARRRQTWGWQALATVQHLLKRPLKLVRAPLSAMEGDPDVLRIENLWGRLLELLINRRNYISNVQQVRVRKSI